MEKLLNLLNVAKQASLKAGEFLLEEGHSMLSVDLETRWDIKIAADKASERIILDYLKSKTDFSILSEETGMFKNQDSEYLWIVDPLDGTFNYVHGIPFCCISIGLWKNSKPVLGVVYDFNRKEIFAGIVGTGAWLNEKQIKVSFEENQKKAVLCTGFPVNSDFSTDNLVEFAKKIQSYKKIRMFGSAALSLAYVACGRVDAYQEDNIMFWDVAGGIALAKAAGGKIDYKVTHKQNCLNVFVSNGK